LSSKRRKNPKGERKIEYVLSKDRICSLQKIVEQEKKESKGLEEVSKRLQAKSEHGTAGSTAQLAAERKECRRTECEAGSRLKIEYVLAKDKCVIAKDRMCSC
jgi:hypothetical protein